MVGKKKMFEYIVRFYPAGTYTWRAPKETKSVDAFLVGGGSGGVRNQTRLMSGAGGETKTYKSDLTGYRDGNAIPIIDDTDMQVVVGSGGPGTSGTGYVSQGGSSSFGGYIALGGYINVTVGTITGGSSGLYYTTTQNVAIAGRSDGDFQGHTTKDFGESQGQMNSGGGSLISRLQGTINDIITKGGTGYYEGKGDDGIVKITSNVMLNANGGGGYGGGGGLSYYAASVAANTGDGGDGTVLLRFLAYEGYVAPTGATIEKITEI